MEQCRVGRSGLAVSRLGLGTMTWGREVDGDTAGELLTTFVNAGGTLVDTAAAYGDGESERMLGALIGTSVRRADLVIITKAGIVVSDEGHRADTSRRRLLTSLDESLSRLRTDHVDLWLVHAWSADAPLDETLSSLDYAVASGRARYAGVAGHSGWQVARAATWQEAGSGRTSLVAAAAEYSLVQRGVEREVMPACNDLGMGLLAWSPLGRGVLTGKYRHGIPDGSRAASPAFEDYVSRYFDQRSRGIVDAVVTAADGLGVAPSQVALSWLRERPGVAASIVGARTAEQLRVALASEKVSLPIEISTALDEVSAPRSYD